MKYEIRFWREVLNSTLHILVGAIISHTFLAYLSISYILIILLLLGIGREYWQYKRGKIQPLWIQCIDAAGFVLGGLIWYLLVSHFGINVDLLLNI